MYVERFRGLSMYSDFLTILNSLEKEKNENSNTIATHRHCQCKLSQIIMKDVTRTPKHTADFKAIITTITITHVTFSVPFIRLHWNIRFSIYSNNNDITFHPWRVLKTTEIPPKNRMRYNGHTHQCE